MTKLSYSNAPFCPPAEIHPSATLEAGVTIWGNVQIRENVSVGAGTIIGRNTIVEPGVKIGRNVKIGSNSLIFSGVTIEDGVFVGPSVCFTNDKYPRAINPDGSRKSKHDWQQVDTLVRRGASIGARSVVLCGLIVGEWAMIGAGSVVTKTVGDYSLVSGNIAKFRSYVCAEGKRFPTLTTAMLCESCQSYRLSSPSQPNESMFL